MPERSFPISDELFFRGRDIAGEQLGQVEGAATRGKVIVKTLMATTKLVMLESFREQGVIDPTHQHDDHETVCYLVSGALRLTIGNETFVAGPGDCWLHPVGVPHAAEALEDSVQMEVKVPPVKTW